MRSRFCLPRRVAAACAVAGATTLLNGNCSAQTFIAADYATNPIYASGWTTNQNGGYGFTAWSFDGTSTNAPTPIEQKMTFGNSSPANALGTAWTLFNPAVPGTNAGYGYLSEAGRGFAALQPYQTFEVVIDNPTNVYYGDGWFVELDSGTDNYYTGSPTVLQVSAYVYAYYSGTNWIVTSPYGNTTSSLSFANTAPAGVKMDFTILQQGNYQLTLTPLNNPTNAYTHVDALENPGMPTDWMDFRFYDNEITNGTTMPTNEFYISSMTIANPTLNIQLAGTNAVLTWLNVSSNLYGATNLLLESSTNLGPAAVWNPVPTPPVVVNGQNVVTNPVAGARQFYRLSQ